MQVVSYDESHFDAVHRIWTEVGWVEAGNDSHQKAMRAFLSAGRGSVVLVDGAAEAFGHWVPGSVRYVDSDLGLCAVTAITTSRVARRQGFATEMTLWALREGSEAGCAIASLGIFDQGFYDRFGFGTGSYEHRWSLDPASLTVDVPYRVPIRLSPKDWEEVHGALVGRHRAHGTVILDPPEVIKAELLWLENPVGLGYRDASGRLSHFVMGSTKGEHGPYNLQWLVYETPDQLLELLRLIKELADQVASVVIYEPPEIQLQDVVARPFRQRTRTVKSEHEASVRAIAFWQTRILDLEKCVAARSWVGPVVRFNLELSDPLDVLAAEASVGGEYVVTIGQESEVESGNGADLPTLRASVNAFSRMWMGVRPASSLAITDDLAGPSDLVRSLDGAFALPEPHQGWFF